MTARELSSMRVAVDECDERVRRLRIRAARCQRAALRWSRVGRKARAADWWRALVRAESVRRNMGGRWIVRRALRQFEAVAS